MDVKKAPEQEPHITAGESFVKRIGPAGCVLFLALAVLVAAICLTTGRDPIPGYAPPETTEYYAAHLDELVKELETNVFTALSDYTMTAEITGSTVTVTVGEGNLAAARSAILRYFDESLFSFERSH